MLCTWSLSPWHHAWAVFEDITFKLQTSFFHNTSFLLLFSFTERENSYPGSYAFSCLPFSFSSFPLLLQKTTKHSPPCCSHCKTTAGSILPIALNTSGSPCIQGIYNLPILFHLTRCKPHLFGLSAAPALPTIAACVEECGLTFFLMCKIWKSFLLDVNCKKHRFAFFQLSPLICLTAVIAMCRSMPKEYAKKEYWLPHYSRVVR